MTKDTKIENVYLRVEMFKNKYRLNDLKLFFVWYDVLERVQNRSPKCFWMSSHVLFMKPDREQCLAYKGTRAADQLATVVFYLS